MHNSDLTYKSFFPQKKLANWLYKVKYAVLLTMRVIHTFLFIILGTQHRRIMIYKL